MAFSEGGLLRVTVTHRPMLLAAFAGVWATLCLALIAAGPPGGLIVRLMAAALGTWFALRGWRAATGRVRRARGWITVAMGVWLVSESGRVAGWYIGYEPQLVELSLLGVGVAAIGTYIAAVRGRMRRVEEAAVYLDTAGIFFGIIGAVLVLGSTVVTDPIGLGVLLHASFFTALLAATLLVLLATRARLRFIGPWEVLAGIAVAAVGYVGLLLPTADAGTRPFFNAVVGAGVLIGAHGGSAWNADEEHSARYEAIAGSLRAMLPLTSAVITGAVGLVLITRPELVHAPLRIPVAVMLGLVVVSAIARQTLMLVDREKVLTRERRLTDELTVAEAQYRSVVERVPGVVYVAEAGQHGRWHFVSTKIEELLGYTAEEWMTDPTLWLNRMHPSDRDRMIIAENEDQQRAEAKGRWEYRLIARDGRVVWVIDDEAVISRDDDGRPLMVQGILVDISDRKALENQLRHQALHDPLTGLPNRVLFVDRLSHAIVRRGRGGDGLAVLFVDLDEFKAVNDTLGHAVGDRLLSMVGARLAEVVRAEDTACRLGGDEFAFLLEDAPEGLAERVAGRILSALAEPFSLDGRTASLTASIGIATRHERGEGSPSDAADELLRDADTAMYAAKSLGKGRVRVFDRAMEAPAAKRRDLRNALEMALEADDLFLEYQPIVDMESRSTIGLEALVRWLHPQLGRLLPADFIALAEEAGLIGRLGDWVMRRACEDLAKGTTTLVSINVSAHQLGTGDLPRRIDALARETGMAPSRLVLELTESTLASAGAGAESELQAIQALGVRIALDDFGSGYSSLEYLGRLPIDILKVDRSLIEHAEEPQRQEVLRAILHIAEKLGLDTIVEGVEHEAQRATLLELGFRTAQGFLFSPAVPFSSLDPERQLRAS